MSGDRGWESVMDTIEKDMRNPAYRKKLEQEQAVKPDTTIEELLTPFAGPLLRSVKAAAKPAEKMTTLYRAEDAANTTSLYDTLPKGHWMRDQIKTDPHLSAREETLGKWFTDSKEKAQHYLGESYHPKGALYQVKIPAKEAELYRVSNTAKGSPGRELSRRPEEEFTVPSWIRDKKKEVK